MNVKLGVVGGLVASFAAPVASGGPMPSLLMQDAVLLPEQNSPQVISLDPTRSDEANTARTFPYTWYNREPSVSGGELTGRELHAMAYDSIAQKTILFGGLTAEDKSSYKLDDTWAYDYPTNTWTQLNPNVTGGDLWPTAYHAMAYDSQNGVTIRFAGSTTLSTRTNETWEYDYSGNTWTMLDPTIVGPPDGLPGRIHHAMVYDENAGVIIMMGGLGRENGSSVLLDDTWEYSRGSNTWTKLQPTIEGGTFVARYLHAMAYDPAADTTILLGGLDVNGTELGDTWEYDHSTNTWTWIDTTIVGGSSIARRRHAMVYDSHIASIVLFGGVDPAGCQLNDTWTYDRSTETWTLVWPDTLGGTLWYREEHCMVYDANARAIIMFAGYRYYETPCEGGAVFLNDTWELRPTRGDFDGDGDVDLEDAGLFINCLNGPDVTSPPSGCEADDFEAADLEDDSDVDERDFVGFQQFFTG